MLNRSRPLPLTASLISKLFFSLYLIQYYMTSVIDMQR
jgi:hypothetical protein